MKTKSPFRYSIISEVLPEFVKERAIRIKSTRNFGNVGRLTSREALELARVITHFANSKREANRIASRTKLFSSAYSTPSFIAVTLHR